jgi:fused signal recognition particle receptor
MSALEQPQGWLARLKAGLGKTASNLGGGISAIFTKRKLDAKAREELEALLIMADLGAATATRVTAALAKSKFDKEVTDQEVREALAEEITNILTPFAGNVDLNPEHKPNVLVVVGVNGNGKTTTIGKMAHLLKEHGYSVMLAAADTFRAAAVEQLVVWGRRAGVPVITGEHNADPASVVFRAREEAARQGIDVLLVDTAGRLHNKANLMEELKKIVRVLARQDPTAPHAVIQVLDATTGQNAHAQVEAFKSLIGVTGLVITKLDGTAKGGVVVSLAEKFKLPVHAIGVGEGIEDFRPMEPAAFARAVVGL